MNREGGSQSKDVMLIVNMGRVTQTNRLYPGTRSTAFLILLMFFLQLVLFESNMQQSLFLFCRLFKISSTLSFHQRNVVQTDSEQNMNEAVTKSRFIHRALME